MQDLINSFNNQKIIRKGEKGFLVLPLTDHCVATEPILLRQAINAICDLVNWNQKGGIDMVVSEEERGGFIAVGVAMQRNIPFSLAKQNPVHLKGEIGVNFSMAYNDRMSLYLNGVKKGSKVILIDDIVDTGGTMIAMIKALKQAGVEIKEIIAIAEKIEMKGCERIKRETGFEVKTILKLDTSGIKSKVVGTIFD